MSALWAWMALHLPTVREPVTALPPLQAGERQVSLGYTSSVPGVAYDLRTGRAGSLAGGVALQRVRLRGAVAQAPGGVMGALSVGHGLPELGLWQLSAAVNYSLGRGLGVGRIDPGGQYIQGAELAYWAHTPTVQLRAVTSHTRGFEVPLACQAGLAWDSISGASVPFFQVSSGAIWTLREGTTLGLGVRLDYLDRGFGGYANASLGFGGVAE